MIAILKVGVFFIGMWHYQRHKCHPQTQIATYRNFSDLNIFKRIVLHFLLNTCNPKSGVQAYDEFVVFEFFTENTVMPYLQKDLSSKALGKSNLTSFDQTITSFIRALYKILKSTPECAQFQQLFNLHAIVSIRESGAKMNH